MRLLGSSVALDDFKCVAMQCLGSSGLFLNIKLHGCV